MKKRNSKKGFTLVELVIVIAVIAILASVLIPTFGGIIDKANQSAVQQEAANAFKEVYALDLADGSLDGGAVTGYTKPASCTNYTWTVTNNTSYVFVYETAKYTATYTVASGVGSWSFTPAA